VLQCVAVCCSVLQCVAVCCSVLQCVAVCCIVCCCVVCTCRARWYGWFLNIVLQCVAVCCSVLQCVAVCCSVLQFGAMCCVVRTCRARWCGWLPSSFRCHRSQQETSRPQYPTCVIMSLLFVSFHMYRSLFRNNFVAIDHSRKQRSRNPLHV